MRLCRKRLTGRKLFTITDSLFIRYERFCLFNMLSTITVLFIHQLMHQWVVLKNNIKIYIYIKTAPACFGVTVTPSSGSALICAVH